MRVAFEKLRAQLVLGLPFGKLRALLVLGLGVGRLRSMRVLAFGVGRLRSMRVLAVAFGIAVAVVVAAVTFVAWVTGANLSCLQLRVPEPLRVVRGTDLFVGLNGGLWEDCKFRRRAGLLGAIP